MNIFDKKDFPILARQVHGNPLAYLDNASTTQKPREVIDAVVRFYEWSNANTYRGVHTLGEEATSLYEQARAQIAAYIGCKPNELVFTSGTTESINMVAHAWALNHLKEGDEIVLSVLEHHANLLPWQHVAQKTGAHLRFIPLNEQLELDMHAAQELIGTRTKFVAITHASNAIGTHVDIGRIAVMARAVGARILVDAAQTVPRMGVDLRTMDVDFLAFSGHKMCGPTGIGGLFIRESVHRELEPFMLGGGMVFSVQQEVASFMPMPQLLEAGTPPIAQAVGLAVAARYIEQHTTASELQRLEAGLCRRFIEGIETFNNDAIRIITPTAEAIERGHMVAFEVRGIHAHDVAAYLDRQGIAVRAGNHCAQPLAVYLGISSFVRVSFYGYSDETEVDRLVAALHAFLKA
jgi:cysteine desulfurase/selenocysteine lyase